MSRDDLFHKDLWKRGEVGTLTRQPDSALSFQSGLSIIENVRECHTCGLFQHVPDLEPGQVADCQRCDGQLSRRRRTSEIMAPLGFCVSSVALFLALLINILLILNVHGRENTVAISSGPLELIAEGFGEIGILVAVVTIFVPGTVLCLMLMILYGASRPDLPYWVRPCLAWYEHLRPWSMIEVYVIGVLVAYTKLVDMAVVLLQPGIFLIGALMITMAAMDSTFDAERVWKHASLKDGTRIYHDKTEGRSLPPSGHMLSCRTCDLAFVADSPIEAEADMGDCPRCGQILRRRKRRSISSCLAFLTAAFIFYIPANLFPVMTYGKVGYDYPNTIISGVIELWQGDMYFLSLLVLFASITVPVLKIVSLALMVYVETRGRGRGWNLRHLSKLYRVVTFVGRWSMIDVFMISILVAVVRFSFLARVTADPGVVFFALVVILTIFAADLYDPRGMWDAGEENAASAQTGLDGQPAHFPEHLPEHL